LISQHVEVYTTAARQHKKSIMLKKWGASYRFFKTIKKQQITIEMFSIMNKVTAS
jgi:late competence protein required for DNA uptake (superfamily II DNA/RNA helicase)